MLVNELFVLLSAGEWRVHSVEPRARVWQIIPRAHNPLQIGSGLTGTDVALLVDVREGPGDRQLPPRLCRERLRAVGMEPCLSNTDSDDAKDGARVQANARSVST